MGLRLFVLSARFVLVLTLAKFLPPELVGRFGVLAAAVTYAIYPVGLEFWVFNHRKLAGIDKEMWGSRLRSQLSLSGTIFCLIAAPVMVLWVYKTGLPLGVAVVVALLVYLEYVAFEIERLLTLADLQVSSSLLLILRQGLWPFLMLGLFLTVPASRNLGTVFGLWAAATMVAIGVGVLMLKKRGIRGWNQKAPNGWIATGLKVALPMLVAILCMKGVFVADRIMVSSFAGEALAGAYFFYIGFANAQNTLCASLLQAFAYPKVLTAGAQGDYAAVRAECQKLAWQSALLCLAAGVFLVAVGYGAAAFIGEPLYALNWPLMIWLVLAIGAWNVSLAWHFQLFATNQDRALTLTAAFGFGFFLLAAFTLSRVDPVFAVPIALFLTSVVLGVVRCHYSNKTRPLVKPSSQVVNI